MRKKFFYMIILAAMSGWLWSKLYVRDASEEMVEKAGYVDEALKKAVSVPGENATLEEILEKKDDLGDKPEVDGAANALPPAAVQIPQNPQEDAQLASVISRHNLEVKEITSDGSFDVAGLDKDLVAKGEAFAANFNSLLDSPGGEELSFKFRGKDYLGIMKKKETTDAGYTFVQLDLDGNGGMLKIHFGLDKKIGTIYTESGQYVFEQKGDIGFIMGAYEYKKLKNTLQID